MQTIAAIPTTYKGYRFRSRLEARWAVFFDVLGVPFEYELQGYSTSEGWYLPDFWLPTLKVFGEVKPVKPPREALAKCAAVAHGTGFPFLMLVGTPDNKPYMEIQPDGSSRMTQIFGQVRDSLSRQGLSQDLYWRELRRDYDAAINAARGARFDTPLTP